MKDNEFGIEINEIQSPRSPMSAINRPLISKPQLTLGQLLRSESNLVSDIGSAFSFKLRLSRDFEVEVFEDAENETTKEVDLEAQLKRKTKEKGKHKKRCKHSEKTSEGASECVAHHHHHFHLDKFNVIFTIICFVIIVGIGLVLAS